MLTPPPAAAARVVVASGRDMSLLKSSKDCEWPASMTSVGQSKPPGDWDFGPPVESESNKGNPAARHYTGMSAAAERGMVTQIMQQYEGYGDLYIPRISGS